MARYVMHASTHADSDVNDDEQIDLQSQVQAGDEKCIGEMARAAELESECQQLAAGAEEEDRQNVNPVLPTPNKEDQSWSPFIFDQQPSSSPFGPSPFGSPGQNHTPKRWSQLKRDFSVQDLEGVEERYRDKHKDYKFWEGVECAAKEIRADLLYDEIEMDIQEYARAKAAGELDEDMIYMNDIPAAGNIPQPKLIELPVMSAEEQKKHFMNQQLEDFKLRANRLEFPTIIEEDLRPENRNRLHARTYKHVANHFLAFIPPVDFRPIRADDNLYDLQIRLFVFDGYEGLFVRELHYEVEAYWNLETTWFSKNVSPLRLWGFSELEVAQVRVQICRACRGDGECGVCGGLGFRAKPVMEVVVGVLRPMWVGVPLSPRTVCGDAGDYEAGEGEELVE